MSAVAVEEVFLRNATLPRIPPFLPYLSLIPSVSLSDPIVVSLGVWTFESAFFSTPKDPYVFAECFAPPAVNLNWTQVQTIVSVRHLRSLVMR